MNKKTIALTEQQYIEIIKTMREGFLTSRPNERVAMSLILEANLGIRISDIIQLKLNDIVKDGDRYRLDITEQKTGKQRTFTVPTELMQYIRQYCLDNNIKSNEIIFPITERAVQKHLKLANPTVTGIVQRLEEKKLIERFISNDDSRYKCHVLTDEGHSIIKELADFAENTMEQRILNNFSEDEKDILTILLRRILKNLENNNCELYIIKKFY